MAQWPRVLSGPLVAGYAPVRHTLRAIHVDSVEAAVKRSVTKDS